MLKLISKIKSSLFVKKKSYTSILDLPNEIIVYLLSAHQVLATVDIFNVLVGVPELEEICFDRKVLESMGTMDYEELLNIVNRSTTEAQHRWYMDPRVQKKLIKLDGWSLTTLLLKISNGTKSLKSAPVIKFSINVANLNWDAPFPFLEIVIDHCISIFWSKMGEL